MYEILTGNAVDSPDGSKYADCSYCGQVEIISVHGVLHSTETHTYTYLQQTN